MAKQKKKKQKKAKKATATNVPLMPEEETAEVDDLDDVDSHDEDEESGIHLEKEDIQLIYNALKHYKPTGGEDVLYETLLEQFEEILVVDYNVKLPGVEW